MSEVSEFHMISQANLRVAPWYSIDVANAIIDRLGRAVYQEESEVIPGLVAACEAIFHPENMIDPGDLVLEIEARCSENRLRDRLTNESIYRVDFYAATILPAGVSNPYFFPADDIIAASARAAVLSRGTQDHYEGPELIENIRRAEPIWLDIDAWKRALRSQD